MVRRTKVVKINAHPEFFNKMETLRKSFMESNGIRLSQLETTKMLARSLVIPKLPNLLNTKNVKKKR